MSVLELSRWQFGITTVYHFLFVPITIGLGFLVAGFETAWIRTGDYWSFRLMIGIGLLPFVLLYQGWTHWVFRKRLGAAPQARQPETAVR